MLRLVTPKDRSASFVSSGQTPPIARASWRDGVVTLCTPVLCAELIAVGNVPAPDVGTVWRVHAPGATARPFRVRESTTVVAGPYGSARRVRLSVPAGLSSPPPHAQTVAIVDADPWRGHMVQRALPARWKRLGLGGRGPHVVVVSSADHIEVPVDLVIASPRALQADAPAVWRTGAPIVSWGAAARAADFGCVDGQLGTLCGLIELVCGQATPVRDTSLRVG